MPRNRFNAVPNGRQSRIIPYQHESGAPFILRGAMPPSDENVRSVRANKRQPKGQPPEIHSQGMHFSAPPVWPGAEALWQLRLHRG